MKIILAVMAAVIVISVVALGAALMSKPDVVVWEVPVRVAPDPGPAFTGDENRQRQPQPQHQPKLQPLGVPAGVPNPCNCQG